jgi:membrane protein YdbS with pleckstrin-like domain
MSDSPKNWMEHIRKAVLLLLGVAAGVRIAWELLAPAVPVLVSLAVTLTVLRVALIGRRSK